MAEGLKQLPSNATMEDVPADLRVLVEQALAEGRRQLSNRGNVDAVFLVRLADGGIQRAALPAPMNQLMDSGDAKSLIFSFVRAPGCASTACRRKSRCGWRRKTRPSYTALQTRPASRWRKASGLVCSSVLKPSSSNVQTETDVVILQQTYTRYQAERRVEFGARSVTRFPQEGFRGRQKMYGVKSDADII